jgi:hypothetical protein
MPLKSIKEIMLALVLPGVIVTMLTSAMTTAGFAQGTSTVASPASSPSLPPVQTQGQTDYLMGGIGLDESEAIKKEGRSWPLMLEFAQGSASGPAGGAEYVSNVKIVIKDKSGNVVLDANAEGPFMLVKLAPGRYSLDATYEATTLHRDLKLEKGQNRKITLLWPPARNQD